jgi:hypothetical protein
MLSTTLGPIITESYKGFLSACELLQRLTHDRVIPQYFLSKLPSQAPYLIIVCFTVFCGILYASSGASLQIVSKMYVMSHMLTGHQQQNDVF